MGNGWNQTWGWVVNLGMAITGSFVPGTKAGHKILGGFFMGRKPQK